MTDSPLAGLTPKETERLRERMRNALADSVASAARRVAGVDELAGLDHERARQIAPTRDGRLIKAVCDATANAFIPLIADLTKRVSKLEAQQQQEPAAKYFGPWSDNQAYGQNSMVSMSGGLWIAREGNVGCRPGTSKVWQLAVKKGRGG
jgi:hypothetical protein